MTAPTASAGEQGDDGVPLLAATVAARTADDDPGDVEDDLGLAAVGPQDRFLDHRDRAVATAEQPRLD